MRKPKKMKSQSTPQKPDNTQPGHSPNAQRVEGEGSYEATHRYDDAVQKTIQSGRVPDLAKKAREAIDGPDAAELTEAEEKGKKPQLPE